jgi:hypothetical protein
MMRCTRFLVLLVQLTAVSSAGNLAVEGECKKLPGDAGWPAPEVWTAALPGVVPRGEQDPDATRPDYQLIATSV